jgi:hypothetical protein
MTAGHADLSQARPRVGGWVGFEGVRFVRFVCLSRVNVNTTGATAGATALLLPAQNTHTLHDPKLSLCVWVRGLVNRIVNIGCE